MTNLRAKSQLNESVSAYKEKNYDIAEKYARRALELDNNNENAWLDLAIILSAEYRRGDISEANQAKATEAIDLYRRLESKDPNNDQAYSFVTVLLGYLAETADQQAKTAGEKKQKAEEEKQKAEKEKRADDQAKWEKEQAERAKEQDTWEKEQKKLLDERQAWIQKRVDNPAVTPDRRSDALAILAKSDFDCSIAITDSKDSKKLIQNGDKVTVQYNKPADDQYNKAKTCIANGLPKVENAISLNPNSDQAWSLKAAFLREQAKVAKWDKNDSLATDFEKQATDAAQKSAELKKANQPPPTPPPAT